MKSNASGVVGVGLALFFIAQSVSASLDDSLISGSAGSLEDNSVTEIGGVTFIIPTFNVATLIATFNEFTLLPATIGEITFTSQPLLPITTIISTSTDLFIPPRQTGSSSFLGVTDTTELHSGSFVHSSTVPVPATMWLFGSGLIGLIGLAKHNKAQPAQ